MGSFSSGRSSGFLYDVESRQHRAEGFRTIKGIVTYLKKMEVYRFSVKRDLMAQRNSIFLFDDSCKTAAVLEVGAETI